MNNTHTTINTVLKYGIMTGLVLALFTPLYVSNSLFFPFITGKAFAFRIIVEIVFALWLALFLCEKGTSVAGTDASVAPRVNLLTLFVTAFALIALVADLAGVNPLRSIWSNFERMEGWVTIIHLWAYFIVLSSFFGSGKEAQKNWNRFLNISLVAGGIVAIYGLFQYFGWAETHQGATRVDASLGNSAYMAVYMLINAFLAGYMALGNFSKKKPLFWTYSISAAIFSFVMFQTATRGTILGWVGAILLSCAIYAIFGRKNKGEKSRTRLIAGGVIVLFIILGTLFYFNRNAQWITSNAVLGRLATISINDTKTQARGYIWPMAIKGVFQSPKTAIIGWGQENFNYIFNANYNPQMWSQEQWFDRAHSVFLDWLVAGGLLGLISYLSLFVLAFIYVSKSDLPLAKKSVLIGLLAGYAVHNVFVFDNQTSYLMFFTILAFTHSLSTSKPYFWFRNSTKSLSENARTVIDYICVPIIIIATLVTFYFVDIRLVRANAQLITAVQACSNGGNPSAKLFSDDLALNAYTANQEIREQLISCLQNIARSNLPIEEKGKFYTLTKSEIDKQVHATPNDARIYDLAGSMFNALGEWTTATTYLTKAHELSPTKQTIDFELITNYLNTKKTPEALALAEQAYLSAPDFELAKIAYIATLIYADQEAKAHKLFDSQPELFDDQRIINVYGVKKNYPKVIEGYKKLIVKNPNNAQFYLLLTSAYISQGQTSLALNTLTSAKSQFPQAVEQLDALIQQIKDGKNPFQ